MHRLLANRLLYLTLFLLMQPVSRSSAWQQPPDSQGPGAVVKSATKGSKSQPAIAKAPFDAEQAKKIQAAWAKHLGIAVETKNSFQTPMVLIPPGKFLMGSSPEQVAQAISMAVDAKIDERTQDRIRQAEVPQHPRTVNRPFLMAATEVTIEQFRQFVKATGYQTDAERLGAGNSATPKKAAPGEENGFTWRAPGFVEPEDAAVSQVSWNDAVVFCNWLSEQEDLPPSYKAHPVIGWELLPQGVGYRLPTETEWEYAARAGTTSQYHFGDDARMLSDYAWFGSKSGSTPERHVGAKRPNAFGLFDMHGNMGEWCQDFYEPTSYPKHALNRPLGEAGDTRRAIRGGDWWTTAIRCRSAFRGYGDQVNRSDDLGFRLARTPAAAIGP
ncbi:formylglycine-generating enzyme family protein [Lignipirellula cremea]|uniref:Serine/threonine-protein kinase pkn1 n=1 Tax=Lignipirellula cremea TaxID=2528010 RepID=A0A518DUI2_9BACT|nr:formylglycine-generating enzyme family protein [Lignipirellula cremea]QDU95496.1 Serine/threonine-protein kinase pkn1 [Lignipirellula cremea]